MRANGTMTTKDPSPGNPVSPEKLNCELTQGTAVSLPHLSPGHALGNLLLFCLLVSLLLVLKESVCACVVYVCVVCVVCKCVPTWLILGDNGLPLVLCHFCTSSCSATPLEGTSRCAVLSWGPRRGRAGFGPWRTSSLRETAALGAERFKLQWVNELDG